MKSPVCVAEFTSLHSQITRVQQKFESSSGCMVSVLPQNQHNQHAMPQYAREHAGGSLREIDTSKCTTPGKLAGERQTALGTAGRGIEIVEWDSSDSSSDQNSGSSSVHLSQLMTGQIGLSSKPDNATGDP